MSGGSLKKAHVHVIQFADDLENRIAADDIDDVPRDTNMVVRLTKLVPEARRLAALMKEADLFYSDDIGEETFMHRVAQIEDEYGE